VISTGKFPTSFQEFIYIRTYSRWVEEKSRRETWPETVQRYTNFIQKNLGDKLTLKEINDINKAILNFEVMPSMRALWAAGGAAEADNLALYNCSFIAIEELKNFAEILYILMNGTGAGFTVEKEFINKLPVISEETKAGKPDVIVFEDSKIGWAQGFEEVLNCLWKGIPFECDYSKIRPRGARLKTMGGRASGPEPLKDLVRFVTNIVEANRGHQIQSIDAHDICCKIADIVVVGGVRRSACISLSDLDDRTMAGAKKGEFWNSNPQRMLANNSATYLRKPSVGMFLEEWKHLYQSNSGERGIFNRMAAKKKAAENHRRDASKVQGTNPCLTGDTIIAIADGRNGISIKQLAAQGQIFPVYCAKSTNVSNQFGESKRFSHWKPEIKFANAFKSGTKEVIEVLLSDGSTFRCTPDHQLATKDGRWIEAQYCDGEQLAAFEIDNSKPEIEDKNIYVTEIIWTNELEDVYDLTVEDNHNFYIITNTDDKKYMNCSGVLVHNCGEILLRSAELCNLSEVVVRPEDTFDTLKQKVKIATLLGTCQATFTKFNYIDPKWIANCEEERLLGVSLTGLRDHPILGNVNDEAKKWLADLKHIAIQTNKKAATKLGINRATAITCIKPSGTVSLLVDSAPGAHVRQTKTGYYIRRVRISATDPLFRLLAEQGAPFQCEVGQSPENCSSYVLEFPCKAPLLNQTRNNESAIEQLEYWKMLRTFWCEHNPSITVSVKEEEWLDTAAWVYRNFDDICGVSFLPSSDHVYQLAPYEDITKEQYEKLIKEMPKINFDKLNEYELEDGTLGSKEYACTSGSCELI